MNIKLLEGEIWKPFPVRGFPDYKVSNFGRIYTERRQRLLGLRPNHKGYLCTEVNYMKQRKTFLMHRLVAYAFLPSPSSVSMQINHIDGDKKNNHALNLEWVTPSENSKHAFRIGLQCNQGERHPQAKYTNDEILKIRSMFKEGYTRKMLAEKFNTKPSNIKSIVLRKSWSHI